MGRVITGLLIVVLIGGCGAVEAETIGLEIAVSQGSYMVCSREFGMYREGNAEVQIRNHDAQAYTVDILRVTLRLPPRRRTSWRPAWEDSTAAR